MVGSLNFLPVYQFSDALNLDPADARDVFLARIVSQALLAMGQHRIDQRFIARLLLFDAFKISLSQSTSDAG